MNRQERIGPLLAMMQAQQVVDSHAHLPPEDARLAPGDIISELTGQYVGHDLISAGMPQAAYQALSDLSIPLEKRYASARPYLDSIRNTGYGQCLDRTVRGLFCKAGLTADTLATCEEAFLKTRHAQYYDVLLRGRCNIRHCVIDHTGLQWPYRTEGFVQAYNVVHMLTPYSQAILDRFAAFADIRIRGFDSYLQACEAVIMRKLREQRVRVFKVPVAYQRELAFPVATYEDAQREFNEVFARRIVHRDAISPGYAFDLCPAFQSYVLHHLLGIWERHGCTVQFHTGYLAGNAGYLPNARPTGLIPLLFQYPDLRFDLFHIGYPYYMELAAMVKAYPNAYANLCWAHILSPNTAVQALLEFLDTIPLNKIIGFGSDTRIADTVYGHLEMAKEHIAQALAIRMEQGKMDEDAARHTIKALLWDNPLRLYGLS